MKILKYRIAVFAVLLIILSCVSASASFRDVPDGYWCETPIIEMERRGYITGYADGTFRPASPVTAAQFVVIVARCADLKPVPGDNTQANGHWAADIMRAALQAGWYDWDELPPTGERFDLPISRVLAVKILMRGLLSDIRGDYITESRKIRDFDLLDGRYYESVLAAYASGVVQGDGSGDFNPMNGLTRAAACAMIYRALQVKRPDADLINPAPGIKITNPAPEAGYISPAPGIEIINPPESDMVPAVPVESVQNGVAENGWLQVKGARLCNEMGEPIILHGMSSHGLQWFGQFASAEAINNIAAWGANLFRIAMYTSEGGYLENPDVIKEKVIAAADAAVSRNLYVIIDWHILSDGNPMEHIQEAEIFFSDMARRYRDCPAVLYEICNEPNGNITWERDIKPYAERIVHVIREQSPRAVILIGSGTWSQDIHIAARSPLDSENVMYTFHFYAGTHGENLRQRLRDAVTGGLPVFVSEWGTSRADGSGGVYLEESAIWLNLLDELGISWANWSLCDKNETSAALCPGTAPDGVRDEKNLSASGGFVFSRFALK